MVRVLGVLATFVLVAGAECDDPATETDEAHNFAPHYDLHVWLYRDNPRGMFAQFNPNATCAHHKGAAHGH